MSKDEGRLIQRAKKGDPSAFAELYDRYQPAIYRYIFYRVGDVATAEDLTGEVFVRLVEKIDRFAYRGRPLLAWLYTIARNLVMDYHRQAGRSLPLSFDRRLATEATDPEEAVERRLTQRRVAAAIARLTEGQRQVILLKFIEGLDNETTARTLGKSIGAVKALQHRALAALRRILERNGG
ncbi:MAG: sigma-70 family RNA polymerase sigma factor [Anaerolineae bacterium]|nr:sigma-70 family RNA polymerase sigma factor [Anaerolineae bacterium]